MSEQEQYTELVRQARCGSRESLDRLADLVRGRLYAYVFRMVLEEADTQDLVQESMLEMCKFLQDLEHEDRFWPWLRAIAFNKVRRHRSREQQRPRTVPFSKAKEPQSGSGDRDSGLARLVADEMKQLVLSAIGELKPSHRRVLAMRCYEGMGYAQIGELMDRSEFGARILFFRAKKALRRALARKGLGKGFLVTALVLFGKMTAPSEAAAAEVTVTSASLSVGAGAAVVGVAASKATVVSLAAAGAVAVGTVATTLQPGKSAGPEELAPSEVVQPAIQMHLPAGAEQCWYYFPQGAGGPVMMRLMSSAPRGRGLYCKWRQNESANYHYDTNKNTVFIENHRTWRSDLAVWLLPTDGAELRGFISQVQGTQMRGEYVGGTGPGSCVITRRDPNGTDAGSLLVRNRHLLDEEFFRYNWPAGVRTLDRRDAMHKRGWTHFRVAGHLDGRNISGVGQLPFVYETSTEYSPWLKLQIANCLVIEDSGACAVIYEGEGKVVAGYPAGSFFRGLSRPWMGLHTVDVIRRDAAESRISFATTYAEGEEKAQIVLTAGQAELTYTIDMEKDLVERIALSLSDGRTGELRFTYLQDVEGLGPEFAQPQVGRRHGGKRRPSPGILWPLQLMNDD
jgi:RNA polymerase sigma-70 factor (ECF subfamily)